MRLLIKLLKPLFDFIQKTSTESRSVLEQQIQQSQILLAELKSMIHGLPSRDLVSQSQRVVSAGIDSLKDTVDALSADGLRETLGVSRRVEAVERNSKAMATKIQSLADAIGMLPSHVPEFAEVNGRLTGILSQLEHESYQSPRLTPGVLQAWDAITYAADKFDRDKPNIPREPEIMQWAILYLSENRWTVPPEDVMKWLLDMRDTINSRRLIGKFD